MAGGLNKVMIIRNVGRHPEMRFTPSGTPVTTFSVAAGRSWKQGDEKKEETEWFNVMAWSKLGEVCNQYLAKGAKVYVEGRLQARSWEGQDGVKHYKTKVATEMQMLGSAKSRREPGHAGEPSDDDDYA